MTVEDPVMVIGDLEATVLRDYLKHSLYTLFCLLPCFFL